jgi:cytidyltransferase-like protein
MNIYCDGIFDLFHMGHLNHFKNIKEYFDNDIKLIVGLINDETSTKYKRKPIFNEKQREFILSSCIYVDNVIITDMLQITEEFINDNNIDYVVHAFLNIEDESKQDNFFKIPKQLNKFIKIDYNNGISTTDIIESGGWNDIWLKKGKIDNNDLFLLNGWEETNFNPLKFLTKILDKFNIKENEKILEMGCGAGLLSQYLSKYNYIGVDKSMSLVSKHINILHRIALCYDSCDKIFKENFFDYTICNSMLEYLDDYEKLDETINELERVTKKGIYIGSIRCKTHVIKKSKHLYEGTFKHLVIQKDYFLERGFTIVDCEHNNEERYDAYKIYL